MSDAPAMIPVGYMLKHAEPRPDWIGAPQVHEIASVSHCIAKPFADYIDYWAHNGMWLFDSAQAIFDLIAREGLSPPADSRLYYYEAYPLEFAWNGPALPPDGWRPYALDEWAPTAPVAPAAKRLLGYDVIAYLDMIDCSPLSCHAMADELPVNAYCLFDAFETAKAAIEDERFKGCHEGKYRIFAVYAVEA